MLAKHIKDRIGTRVGNVTFFNQDLWGTLLVTQSQKKLKLSGQQDFSRKNFPDKARKSRHLRIRDKCA